MIYDDSVSLSETGVLHTAGLSSTFRFILRIHQHTTSLAPFSPSFPCDGVKPRPGIRSRSQVILKSSSSNKFKPISPSSGSLQWACTLPLHGLDSSLPACVPHRPPQTTPTLNMAELRSNQHRLLVGILNDGSCRMTGGGGTGGRYFAKFRGT